MAIVSAVTGSACEGETVVVVVVNDVCCAELWSRRFSVLFATVCLSLIIVSCFVFYGSTIHNMYGTRAGAAAAVAPLVARSRACPE